MGLSGIEQPWKHEVSNPGLYFLLIAKITGKYYGVKASQTPDSGDLPQKV